MTKSSTEVANVTIRLAKIAGPSCGSSTSRNDCSRVAPRSRAASSCCMPMAARRARMMMTTNDNVKVTWPSSWAVMPLGRPVYTWVKTRNRATPNTTSGVTIGSSISPFEALASLPRQRLSPMAMATPSGVVISMHSPASLSVFAIALRNASLCQIEPVGSPQYHRNDIDWNDARLRPELNEMRTAMSTGTSDQRM